VIRNASASSCRMVFRMIVSYCVTSARFCSLRRDLMLWSRRRNAGPVQRQAHALGRDRRALRAQRARIDAIHEFPKTAVRNRSSGKRFITTLRPAASAFSAAASVARADCIQITFGGGDNVRASSTTGMMWLELRKMSDHVDGRPISDSEATKGLSEQRFPDIAD